MKSLFPSVILLFCFLPISAQVDKADQLQALEKANTDNQTQVTIATMKSAGRLFAAKDDLTSVIMIIPADSVVEVIDSDSIYLHVVFEDAEGYILRKQAKIDTPVTQPEIKQENQQDLRQRTVNEAQQQESRFTYLENKYGTNMAARLMSGKIWKGMNSEMVNDSWGSPKKINRVISGNTIQEEWIFSNTWLYFENNSLMEWGPTRK